MDDESSEKPQKNDTLWLWKSIFSFHGKGLATDSADILSPKDDHHIPFLSPHANSVVYRCAIILGTSSKVLQHQYELERPDDIKEPLSYARNFLEFCSYKVLRRVVTQQNYLNDKEFRRLTFDMMLAWEVPGADTEQPDIEASSCRNPNIVDEDGWSLFYSNSTKMAVQVNDKKTVGPEAFARIAPACPVIADTITVQNLFDVLTSSSGSGPRLHFLVYDKYLQSLKKVTKTAQAAPGQQTISNLSLAEGEIILDIDGTVPTQPVLQHVGMSAWPGRLTLTNYALYFEAGVGIYDKAVRYDLAIDLKQVIKPELTGPLGARLFDKAVMYKSATIAEPVFLEFPEFKGSSRRDYWLDICLEVLRAHMFIRKYNMKEHQQSEALARAVLGIFRYRAVRESFRVSFSNYKTLLCFNLAESLPGGDMILETLSSRLILIDVCSGGHTILNSPNAKTQYIFPYSLYTLSRLGIISLKEADMDGETIFFGGKTFFGGDVYVGEPNPLESVVKQLKLNTGRAEAAQATVDQVKVEGIDTNLVVMKELLFPIIETFNWLQCLASWEDPFKSVTFVLIFSYMILRDWIKLIVPSIFVFLALVMLWRRSTNKRMQLTACQIIAPPSKNAVEQLLLLQEAVSQVETLIQNGNIVLLKIRALLFAVAPQATDKLSLLLSSLAVVVALLPLKYIVFIVFVESFTRNMPLRKESSDRGWRRVREWWTRIPAAPVQLIKSDDSKKKN